MPINSRQKGARVERLLRDLLTLHGFDGARRGQQFSGGTDSPDVICASLPTVHWECKGVERLNVKSAVAQATRDAGNKIPVVGWKQNGRDWLLVMKLEDALKHLFPYIKVDINDETKE